MITPTQWFDAIKKEIKEKYNITNPKFLVDELELPKDEFDQWLNKMVSLPHLWVQYIYLLDNIFELKPFSPYLEDKKCYEIIDNFLSTLETTEDQHEFILESDTTYSQKLIRIELRFLLRKGLSKIIFSKEPTKLDDKIIYHLSVEQDTLQNMLKTGYLQLEYEDC